MTETVRSPFARAASVFAAEPRAAATPPLVLAEDDRRLLLALAALHIEHGRPEEALTLLQLVDRLAPRDPQTLRLMTLAFVRLGDEAGADAALGAYLATAEAARGDPRRELLRALTLLVKADLPAARAAFARFLERRAEREALR